MSEKGGKIRLVPTELLQEWQQTLARLNTDISDAERTIDEKMQAVAAMKQERDQIRAFVEHAAKFAGSVLLPPAPAPAPVLTAAVPEEVEDQAEASAFDGRIKGLIACYRQHEASPYQKLKHGTRASYDRLLERLLFDCDHERLVDLKANEIQTYYDRWSDGGTKISMGSSLITMLRGLVAFGAATLRDPQCERLQVVLHNMKFAVPNRLTERFTEQDAIKVINQAIKDGALSIALTQAFQFDCGLRQYECIGEFAPMHSEAGAELQWVGGLQWSDIDHDWNLQVRATGERIDLRKAGLVMYVLRTMVGAKQDAEIDRAQLPLHGPVIISEASGKPYASAAFRKAWRVIANAAGLPPSLKNRSSRAGDDTDE